MFDIINGFIYFSLTIMSSFGIFFTYERIRNSEEKLLLIIKLVVLVFAGIYFFITALQFFFKFKKK